jgi:hypothetical protein
MKHRRTVMLVLGTMMVCLPAPLLHTQIAKLEIVVLLIEAAGIPLMLCLLFMRDK